MKVVERQCRENYTIIDGEGTMFTVQSGHTYTTSVERTADNTVMVFSHYWVRVPVRIFEPLREDSRV